jgi:hypothetical protein
MIQYRTFDLQYNFIQNSGIQAAMIGMLTAIPKTPLYERLERDGRLMPDPWNTTDNTKLSTNIIPMQMSYDELVNGYRALYYRLLNDGTIADRIKNKTRYLTNPIYRNVYPLGTQLKSLVKFIARGIVPGGFSRMYHFIRSVPFSKPGQLHVVIQDWVIGLAMRDYVDRNFIQEFDKANDLAGNYLGMIQEAFQRYHNLGALEVSLNRVKNAAANLSISMKGWLDRDFFDHAAPYLEKVLQNTSSSITLNIEEFHEGQRQHLNQLLNRLSRYGDRIYISVHEKLRDVISIDSSVFNLVLEG